MPWNVARIDTPVIATVEADRLGRTSRKIWTRDQARRKCESSVATLAAALQGSEQ